MEKEQIIKPKRYTPTHLKRLLRMAKNIWKKDCTLFTDGFSIPYKHIQFSLDRTYMTVTLFSEEGKATPYKFPVPYNYEDLIRKVEYLTA